MNIILLSGGSGKRLWPLSNDIRSKQFIKIFKKEDGTYESMVQRVYRQIRKGSDITRVLYFFIIGKKAVLTNGFIKKSQKTPKAEKELAKKYKADYERRYGNE